MRGMRRPHIKLGGIILRSLAYGDGFFQCDGKRLSGLSYTYHHYTKSSSNRPLGRYCNVGLLGRSHCGIILPTFRLAEELMEGYPALHSWPLL